MQFERTKDGYEAVVIESMVFALVPQGEGKVTLKYGWTSKAPSECEAAGFQTHSFHPDEAAAKAEIEDIRKHHEQVRALDRKPGMGGQRTPWGVADHKKTYAEGVESYDTAGHGGFKLDRRHNAQVDARWRSKGGWYEEDSEWAIVAATFPHLFTERERRLADANLRNYYPDEYEAINGVVLGEHESILKAQRAFSERHKDDYVVIAAVGLDDGTVRCWATIGGVRQRHDGPPVEEKEFLVPSDEYKAGRNGFVIDPARHPEYQPAPEPVSLGR